MSFNIDLHLHTNRSDGSSTPIEIIEEAASKGLKAIAITDHDTFTFTKELQDFAKSKNLTLINGIELSCMDETTKRKVHILAYGFNEEHKHLTALLEPFKKHVTSQRLKMLETLNEMGFEISKEDIYMHSDILYKQDIALAMEKKGYGSFPYLFTTYFHGDESIEKLHPVTFTEVKAAIKAIHLDGGIAVLAHPRTYNTFDQIPKYISWGLDGVEISHPSYRDGDLDIILTYPLLHFGGSDYHGKLNISKKRIMGNFGITDDNYNQIKELILHDVHD